MTPIRNSTRAILLRCVDNADPADAKYMLTVMYENKLLSAAETFAEIQTRGLAGVATVIE